MFFILIQTANIRNFLKYANCTSFPKRTIGIHEKYYFLGL